MLQKDNILFMFLGNIITQDNIELYNHWFNFIKKSDYSLYVIVHPKIYTEYINVPLWTKLNDRFIIVDKDHHINTSWGDKTIVFATLLIIQYAILKKGNIFKKYVLLSETCAPLYNYNIIKTELLKNDKSWLSSFNELNNRWSQWIAIDQKHINYFINPNTDITYIVNDNTLISKYEYYNKLINISNVHDESFFGNILLDNKADINTININNNCILIDQKLDQWQNNFTNSLIIKNDNENIYNNIQLTYTNWNGFSLDPHNIFRNLSIKDILSDYDIIDNNINWNNFNINDYLDMYPKDAFNMIINYEKDLISKYNKSLESFKNNIDNYIILPWYHPIEYGSWNMKHIINAFNLMTLFRRMFGLTKNNYCDKMLYILQIYEHLISIFFEKNNISKEDYIYIDNKTTCKYIVLSKYIDTIEDYIYGNTITSTILNNALSCGSLFIRKCNKYSKINIYSSALLKNNYSYL